MMWPFNTKQRRVPNQRRESELAKEAAERSLKESIHDRSEVRQVSKVVRHQLAMNHISERITILLKEGQ